MGKRNFWIPRNQHTVTDRQKIVTGDWVGDPTPVPNLVQIRPRGGILWKCVKYNKICIYLFIYTLFSGTHLQVTQIDGFSPFYDFCGFDFSPLIWSISCCRRGGTTHEDYHASKSMHAIAACKTLSVLASLSVCSKVPMICTWSRWCHCHSSYASLKSRLV